MLRLIAIAAALIVWFAVGTAPHVGAQTRSPRLIVLLMVDQMRADYVDRFQHQWSGGLRRLVTEGAWFREADYPYANTVTCSGHASVSTGTLPSIHGMIMNTWWDRDRGAIVACADDLSVHDISYGKPANAHGESSARLLVPTLADELHAQANPLPRVLSFSLKARAAVTMGGQRPDAIAWAIDEGVFATSSAFSEGWVPEVADYIARHPIEHRSWTTWDRALPKSAYSYEDAATGVRSDVSSPTFPHVIRTWDDWQASPLADEYLADMALEVAGQMKVGSIGRTDMIAISFSTLDLVGHAYGPDSHEVQDVLIRLDRTLGDFLMRLDLLVGPGNYVVALSADHGVAPIPERAQTFGLDAGRIPLRAIPDAAQQAIGKILGPGRHVGRLVSSDLYLEDGVYEQLRARMGALDAVRAAIGMVPGVQTSYSRDDLLTHRFVDDSIAASIAKGFVPSRSGDLVVAYKPYWLLGGEGGTSHGTAYRYDTHVPVILFGAGVASGEYTEPVTPLDIAPTLAYLVGITLPHAQGHVLVDAIKRGAPRVTADAGTAAASYCRPCR